MRSIRKWQVLIQGKLIQENKREQIKVEHSASPPKSADMQRLFAPAVRKSLISIVESWKPLSLFAAAPPHPPLGHQRVFHSLLRAHFREGFSANICRIEISPQARHNLLFILIFIHIYIYRFVSRSLHMFCFVSHASQETSAGTRLSCLKDIPQFREIQRRTELV